MRERLLAALAHVTAVLSVAGLVFVILHRYNPLMGFLTNRYTLGVLIVQCLLSLGTALALTSFFENGDPGRGGGKPPRP